MKKAICFFLLVAMALCLVACGGGETVTVYLPDTLIIKMPDGTVAAEAVYEFEKGWQKKETFKMTANVTMEGQQIPLIEMVFSDKCVQTTVTGVNQTTNRYDENGYSISNTVIYEYENTWLSKVETTYTYDEKGLPLGEIRTDYKKDGTTSTKEITYTSAETEDGFTAVYELYDRTYTTFFDKNMRRIKRTTLEKDGSILNQSDIIYDDVNYTVEQKDSSQGQVGSWQITTYKAMEVAPEVAARIPHLVRTFVKQ